METLNVLMDFIELLFILTSLSVLLFLASIVIFVFIKVIYKIHFVRSFSRKFMKLTLIIADQFIEIYEEEPFETTFKKQAKKAS